MSQHKNLPDYSSLLKEQIASQAIMSEYFFQIGALFELALSKEFLYFKKTTIHYYLSVLDDIVMKAKYYNEIQLNRLMKVDWCLNKTPPDLDGNKTH